VPDPLDTLARAAARLDGEDDGLQLVADWLRSRPRDLIEHLVGRGRRGFSAALAQGVADRNQALRAAWRQQWPDLPTRKGARLLEAALRRYAGGAWRHEQHAQSNPHPENAPRGLYWRAMKARGRLLSVRQLERILVSNDATDHLSQQPM
jgi:hypothetical protein